MTSSQPPDDSPAEPEHASFAARLRQKYGEGVDPEVSLDRATPEAPSGAASELLRRLADHSLKQSRYKLEGEIARGGMGAVLRVWDADLRRTLAMKVILGHSDSPVQGNTPAVDPRLLGRFLEEAQITGQLDHPGIAPVHELGLDADGRVYFTMKLVKGRDLKHVFDLVFEGREGWNETRALSVLLKVCEALAYAHKKGVIHRDLKPANVMVGGFGEVYVMDWGLARVLGREDAHDIRLRPEFAPSPSLSSVKTERRAEREDEPDSPLVTMDGDVLGTPAYMPLEQARGETASVSARADVYALGAMLYHLLARQMPYVARGERVTNRTVLARVLDGPPTPIHSIEADVPAELVAIVEKAMARDAAQRYPDTLALAEDLRAYLEHRVVAAYETGAWAEAKKWVLRNKPLAASLAAALLVVSGLGLYANARAVEARDQAQRAERGEAEAKQQALRAAKGESEAQANAEVAQRNAEAAQRARDEATQRANDVLSLSAIQDLIELEKRADALWPAHPENLEKYEAWLADARELIEGRPADPERGVKAKPSLAEHEASLARIRGRALPRTAEQDESDHRASAGFAPWERESARLLWLRRMLGEESWPSNAEVEAALALEMLPADAQGLNSLAWPLVDSEPGKIVYGGEQRALILARRAVAAASDVERASIRDTLAWAFFRTGRLDEALTESRRALLEAGERKSAEYEGYVAALEQAVGGWNNPAARAEREEEARTLAARVADLERAIEADWTTWEFEEGEDSWWHLQLSKLVSGLRAFTDEESGGLYSAGTSEQHGWGIVKRAEFARTLAERSVSGAEVKQAWDEAIAAITASPKYSGLVMTPQLGLIPIGADPQSGLWEFADVQTGAVPKRGAGDQLALAEDAGLVLVLIPGGTFWMGAQKSDASGRNYDPQATGSESPVHEVTLAAYFLSKYEMTQGQWERFGSRNPSLYDRARYGTNFNHEGRVWSALHPVEQVSWDDCVRLLGRLGLELPTEAQWESCCRGGTDTPFWSGAADASLADVANLSDDFALKHGGPFGIFESWDDGNLCHARVGSYGANGFGLHDVHGNVYEWCLDAMVGYSTPARAGDGLRNEAASGSRAIRGGGFFNPASLARSACRGDNTPEYLNYGLGVRPARGITP